MKAVRRSALGLAFAFFAFAPPAAHAEPLPPICTALPLDFSSERTAFIDSEHEALAKGSPTDDYDTMLKERQERARRLQQRIKAESKKNAVNAAILEAEFLRVDTENENSGETTSKREKLIKVLSGAPATKASAEAMAMLAADIGFNEEVKGRYDILTKALTAHRKAFGEAPRQILLWYPLFKLVKDKQDYVRIGREVITLGEKAGSARALIQGQLAVYAELPAQDPERKVLARAITEQALIAVKTPVPAKWSNNGESCFGFFQVFVSTILDAFALLSTEDDRKTFIKNAVLHIASGVAFETHAQFILEDMGLLLAARNIDYEAFLAAMARLETADETCKEPEVAPEICGLLNAAGVLLENNEPALGIILLKDARDVAGRFKVPPRIAQRISVQLADAEWKHGAKSVAAASVDSIPKVADHEALPVVLANLYRLKAEIAEAELDPKRATENFALLVESGLKTLAKPLPKKTPPPDGGEDMEDEPQRPHADQLAIGAVDDVVLRRLRGRFCADCGEESVAIAERWLEGLLDAEGGDAGVAADAYLAARLIAETLDPKFDIAPYEDALVEALGENWKPFQAAAKRILKKKTGQDAPVVGVAIATGLIGEFGAWGNTPESLQNWAESILKFMAEEDMDKQEAIWEDEIAGDLFSESHGLDWFHDLLDELAFKLHKAGHLDAAEFVIEYLIYELEGETDEDGKPPPVPMDRAMARARFWASNYIKFAGIFGASESWDETGQYLDKAQSIVTARLEQEWASSSDRIGPLIRELRSVTRTIAELRVLIAKEAGKGERRPAETFEALQLAMLGETAAGMQASLRRRLLAEPQLRQAIEKRDNLKARQALLKRFDEVAGVFDERARKEEDDSLARELKDIETQVSARLPASESMATLRPLSLKEAQPLLGAEEALLMLHAGEDAIYGTLLRAAGTPLYWRTPIALSELEKKIAEMRKGLDRAKGLKVFPLETAHELFELVLGPAQAELDKTKRLVVLAGGPLVALPLAALPRELPDKIPVAPGDYRTASIKWLGVSHAISYLPAVRALEARKAAPLASKAHQSLAGIGNPVLSNGGTETRDLDFAELFTRSGVADVGRLRKLPPLPETEDEVRAISKIMGGRDEDLFLGPRASETIVRGNGLGDFRVILFSTHGVMGGQLAGVSEPGLILTPPENATAEDDGLLAASEISALKLDADLVILSACNTAASDGRPRAEGFSGLTRAFLSAGARAVIVTHWSIPSIPTVLVTTRMVEEMERGRAGDWSEALRRSFQNMVEKEGQPKYAHPSNWAAFTVVGAGSVASTR